MSLTKLGQLKKDVETIQKIQILLDDAERLAKSLTFLELSASRNNLNIILQSKYREIGELTCTEPT